MSGSRKPPVLLWSRSACGCVTSSSGLQVLHALVAHVERRSPRRSRTARAPAAQHSASPIRSRQRPRALEPRAARRGAAARAAARCAVDATAIRRAPRTSAAAAWRPAARTTGRRSRRAAPPRTRRSSARTARPTGPRRCRRSSTASGRIGSRKKVRPSSGFGREADRARDHREHDRLAERAGGGEHRGGDDRRAGGAHEIVHIARQRLTPSAAAPSVQCAAPRAARRR